MKRSRPSDVFEAFDIIYYMALGQIMNSFQLIFCSSTRKLAPNLVSVILMDMKFSYASIKSSFTDMVESLCSNGGMRASMNSI